MEWLQTKRKPNRIRFRAMMESGEFVDEVADVVQTQVLAHNARASIRNRDAVPLYHHTEENRPPVWTENLIVETGLSPQPGMDSRYVLEDSLNLFKGIRTGSVETEGESKLWKHGTAIAVNVAAVVVFVACTWLTGLNVAPDPTPDQEAVVQEDDSHGFVDDTEGGAVVTEENSRGFVDDTEGGAVVPEENSHGFVDEMEGEGGEEEGAGVPATGGEGSGGGSKEPVGSRVEGGTSEDNALGVPGSPQHGP